MDVTAAEALNVARDFLRTATELGVAPSAGGNVVAPFNNVINPATTKATNRACLTVEKY